MSYSLNIICIFSSWSLHTQGDWDNFAFLNVCLIYLTCILGTPGQKKTEKEEIQFENGWKNLNCVVLSLEFLVINVLNPGGTKCHWNLTCADANPETDDFMHFS